MCLIAFAWRAHPRYALVMAANRDEFHQRPTAPASAWMDAPDVFGGRDLSQGGSWLALSRRGRLAAVTNVRRMIPPQADAPSRGRLVAGFVQGASTPAAFAAGLTHEAERYAGYNLLLMDLRSAALQFVTNQPAFSSEALTPGAHALSNATINTPWPKLRRVREGLAAWAGAGRDDEDYLWSLLADDEPAADDELPQTGVGAEMERFLSPPFIRGERYGTRASTIVMIGSDGRVQFAERRFGPNGLPAGESRAAFEIQSPPPLAGDGHGGNLSAAASPHPPAAPRR